MKTASLQAKLEAKATKEFNDELRSLFSKFRQDVIALTGVFDTTQLNITYFKDGTRFEYDPQFTQLLSGMETRLAEIGIARHIEQEINAFILRVEDLSEQVSELQSQIQ